MGVVAATRRKAHISDASRVTRFDENEPRDDQGRWTDGGGSDGGSDSGSDSGSGGGSGVQSPASGDPGSGAGRAGSAPRPYAGRSPRPSEGSGRDLAAVYEPSDAGKASLGAKGAKPVTIHELTADSAQAFRDAIQTAKTAGNFGAAVHVYEPAEYAGMRTFLTPDGKAGVAVKNDGDIVSVFKHPDSDAKRFAQSALALATQEGGNKLDAFDTVLPRLYSEAGFRAVARLPFNDKYAPPGWDREKFAAYNGGRPDVVFMVYDPQHPHEYVPGEGERVETYEAGEAAQQTALRALDDAHAAAQPAAPAAEKPAPSPTTAMTQIELWPDKFPPLPPPKSDLKLTDFNKEVTVDNGTRTDPKKAGKFLETWNTYVHEAPEAFRNEFLGGLPGTMNINYQWDESGGDDVQNEMSMSGNLLDKDGNKIGSYTRSIDFLNNKASSDYFSLNGREQGKNVGKQMLAANVAMYQKLGLDEVNVHADIDVGGYAWAKYGYVPTEDSWSDLQNTLLDKAGGGSYEPSSWEEMSSDQQDKVRDAWKRDTFDEFQQSEEDNWRDNGGDLHQAKENLTQALTDAKEPPPWFSHALDTLRAGKPDPIPFSDQQLLDSLSVGDYEDRHDDGRADPDITIDETALPEADRAKLTDDMRSDIEGALISAFNDQADKDRSDVDAPDFSDSIGDYQNDVWESMRDRDKFSYASDHGLLGSSESDIDVEPEVRALIEDSDPKAVWAIADSDRGKELLKGTDWYGKLDLHDGETMERFNAYVGKAKAK